MMPSGQGCHIKVALKGITLAHDLSSSTLPPDKVSENTSKGGYPIMIEITVLVLQLRCK